jgi:hypothetical protein
MRRAERWQVLHSDIVHGAVGQSRALLLHMMVQKQHFAKKRHHSSPKCDADTMRLPCRNRQPLCALPGLGS